MGEAAHGHADDSGIGHRVGFDATTVSGTKTERYQAQLVSGKLREQLRLLTFGPIFVAMGEVSRCHRCVFR
jgi:hypothetical protein